jgi:hypothetical protein
MKIYEAIKTAYYYASAFSARLSAGGELSGNLELTDEDRALKSQIEDKVKKEGETPAKEEDKSILHELDDLL